MKGPEINNDPAGMTCWNELTQPERQTALARATDALGHEASSAEAWELWRTGKMDLTRDEQTMNGKIELDEPTPEQRKAALKELTSALRRPAPPVPQAELDLLGSVALGDTGQSRTCRYLLCLLVGAEDPTGFKGQGLLEMRTLDRKLADAFLKVIDWWRGPTKSDLPLYDVLRKLESRFEARTSAKDTGK